MNLATLHKKIRPLTIMGLRLVTLAAKFMLTLFMARFMGLETLGAYGFILGATAVVPIVVSFGLMSLIGRDIVKLTPPDIITELRHYWGLILALYAVLFVPVAFLGHIGPLEGQGGLLIGVVSVIMLEHLGTDTYNILVNRRQPLLANLLLFLRGGGWIFAFMPLALLYPALLTLNALVASWLVGLVLSMAGFFIGTRHWPWRRNILLPISRGWYTKRFGHAWKFFLSDVCSFGGPYLDRYIIGLFFGLKEVGLYVLFWSIANALYTLISTGVMQINRPRLISAHEDNNLAEYKSVYAHTFRHAIMAALALGAGAGVVFPFIVTYLNKPEAVAALPVLWLLMAGLAVRTAADVAAAGLYTRRQDNQLLVTNLAGFALMAGCNLTLIPFLGHFGAPLYGAPLAFSVSYGLLFCLRQRALSRGLRQGVAQAVAHNASQSVSPQEKPKKDAKD